MSTLDVKGDLHEYLRGARETLVWKLDIVRESIDGAAGLLEGHAGMRIDDAAARKAFHDRVEEAARLAAGR